MLSTAQTSARKKPGVLSVGPLSSVATSSVATSVVAGLPVTTPLFVVTPESVVTYVVDSAVVLQKDTFTSYQPDYWLFNLQLLKQIFVQKTLIIAIGYFRQNDDRVAGNCLSTAPPTEGEE